MDERLSETISSPSTHPQPQMGHSPQANKVRDLAMMLFERTQSLHDLDEISRDVLEQAALLHETPILGGKRELFDNALELVRAQTGDELPIEGQNILAAVLAYQGSKLPRKKLSALSLAPQQQRQALTIAALLRLAIGLNSLGGGQTTIEKVEIARDGMWIVIDVAQPIADFSIVQHSARLWNEIGYPEARMLEASAAAAYFSPFPEPTELIGLQPEDTLTEAGRKVMRFHFARVIQHEPGTRLGEDIEALHDMRVATRRLRAAFEVFADAFEPSALKPHLRGLRKTGRTLGKVRDLDVLIEKAKGYLETLPDAERDRMSPLLEAWKEQREQGRAELIAYLDSAEYAFFKRSFNAFLNTPGAGGRTPKKGEIAPTRLKELVPMLIYTRLAAVRAYEPHLKDAPVERLHALRIEFKKLRYTMEYFQEVLGKRAGEVIAILKQIQDHLGELNDAQVATQILHQFINTWEEQQAVLPIEERQSIQGVVNYLAARYAERHQLMVSFPRAWKLFDCRSFRRKVAQSIAVL